MFYNVLNSIYFLLFAISLYKVKQRSQDFITPRLVWGTL